MEEVIKFIENKIKALQSESDQIEKKYEEDYNPSDWSGGNFDDCYSDGVSDGETFGSLQAYKTILEKLNKGDVL
ncbi:hypothetical protein [Paenibacillus tianjinensis]|uniref:Uncharacterized protein n=1 Tax=Paenibacillus tianjinensis TaxID=2810347 RepID=A0ABX7L6L6_9BACL|nr:hypothetical protein [Paenibacillus tianjinensis]QSF43386.1 hypothetical protein JRJ22_19155 [Paenibacillus tianjinensis]